jgi:tellurite resistance protein TerC
VRVPIVLTIGLTVVGVGVALLVLPGPGIAVIIVGLALLATEFAWARALLDRGKHHSRRAYDSVRNGLSRRQPAPQED